MKDATFFPEGMGGFGDPPDYPTHTTSVRWDLRRKYDYSSASIEYAADPANGFPAAIQAEAARRIKAWHDDRPALRSYRVQLWILRTFAHFHNCVEIDGAAKVVGYDGVTAENSADRQPFAEYFIKRFYPEFTGTEADYHPDCGACEHHVNAHANGDGGTCAVIVSETAGANRELCNCPEFEFPSTQQIKARREAERLQALERATVSAAAALGRARTRRDEAQIQLGVAQQAVADAEKRLHNAQQALDAAKETAA